jgi:hypothetical protein
MTVPVDTRDIRGFASEIKFLVDPSTGDRIRDWARARLEPDPFGEGAFGDEYRTTSLYFDTVAFDVFHRRGSYGRSKYRIRRYDGEPVTFLERKLRRDARLSKRRTVVPLEDLHRLDGPAAGWPGHWFRQRLLLRRLLPVCQVSYHRLARVGRGASGSYRLTLDQDVTARARTDIGFDRTVTAVLPQTMVLELKFHGTPPALFKQLVEAFTLAPAGVSKYRLTVSALGLIPEDTPACLIS